ncbi:MAG: hypothetical protein NC924_07230 [Candidatus Omnitrophica bacterium]|nr:hypothetical protein [Candidatus Omnitrophota bacterium]
MDQTITKSPLKEYENSEILQQLLKRVVAFRKGYRQNIALLGFKSTGKTALIFNVLQRIKLTELIPIYLSIKPKPLDQFGYNFIGVLLFQTLRAAEQPLVDDFQYLLETGSAIIPRTTAAIQQILRQLKSKYCPADILGELLHLPQILFDETAKPVLMIFDEFHAMEQIGVPNPFLELSNRIMVQKNTMYILISSAVSAAKEILATKLSLLFGNFELMELHPLNTAMSAALLRDKMGEVDCSDLLREFLIEICGGIPFYLDVVGEQLAQYCRAQPAKTVSEALVLCACGDVLFKEHGILNQYFTTRYAGLNENSITELLRSVLTAVADGRHTAAQIAKRLGRKSADVSRCLNYLAAADMVSKRGVYFFINDRLFAYWLKFVLRNRQNSFNIEIYSESGGSAEAALGAYLQFFARETAAGCAQRLQSLFSAFDNAIIELDNKRFLLPHFESVSLKEAAWGHVLCGAAPGKSWSCFVCPALLDEAHAGEAILLLEGSSATKKIIAAAWGMDANARLKALEAKVLIWDLPVINELCAIFDRPCFVV